MARRPVGAVRVPGVAPQPRGLPAAFGGDSGTPVAGSWREAPRAAGPCSAVGGGTAKAVAVVIDGAPASVAELRESVRGLAEGDMPMTVRTFCQVPVAVAGESRTAPYALEVAKTAKALGEHSSWRAPLHSSLPKRGLWAPCRCSTVASSRRLSGRRLGSLRSGATPCSAKYAEDVADAISEARQRLRNARCTLVTT
jgi:hypothetical protein